MRRKAVPFGALIAASILPASAYAQDKCAPIQFGRGQSSATLRGMAPPNEMVCYTFAAGAGQMASLKVTGRNMMMSVIGIGDARDSYTFRTSSQTYKFIVAQLMRSASPEPYTVTLSIK